MAVGIDNYLYPFKLSPLDASVSNAHKFEGIFLRSNLADEDQTEVLPNSRASREQIREAIQRKLCDPKNVLPEDMVIFYFVGHGILLGETSFGICPYDFRSGEQLISETEIVELINTSPAHHKICLIESCKTRGPMGANVISRQVMDSFNERRKAYPASLVFMTSTEIGKESYQDKALGGPFSHYLRLGLKGKADGEATGLKDGFVSVRELFLFVRKNVMIETSNFQIPQLNDLAYEADIPLIPVIEN